MQKINSVKWPSSIAIILAITFSYPTWAGNDASIKSDLRTNIKSSMNRYIDNQTINDALYVYDSMEGQLLELKLDEQEYYVDGVKIKQWQEKGLFFRLPVSEN